MKFKFKNSLLFLSLLFAAFVLINSLSSTAAPLGYTNFSSNNNSNDLFSFQNLSILLNILLLGAVVVSLINSRKSKFRENFLNQNNLNINLKVLESLKIDQKNSLLLVEAFKEHLLVSLNTDQSFSLISRLSQKKDLKSAFKEKTLKEIIIKEEPKPSSSTKFDFMNMSVEQEEVKLKEEIKVDYLPPAQKIPEIIEEYQQETAENSSDKILEYQESIKNEQGEASFNSKPLGERVKRENPWFNYSLEEASPKITSRKISITAED